MRWILLLLFMFSPLIVSPATAAETEQLRRSSRGDSDYQRAALRVVLKQRGEQTRDRRHKKLLRRIVGDQDLQTLAIAHFESDWTQALSAETAEGEEQVGPVLRFFQWVIENQDQIIAFIVKIIAMFDSMSLEGANLERGPPTEQATAIVMQPAWTRRSPQSRFVRFAYIPVVK